MRHRAFDGLLLALLFLLPLLLFAPVVFGGRTLLPADILYSFEPFRSQAPTLGVTQPPHNGLLADLVLENYVWKQTILEAFRSGQLPLWDPYLFSGHPFLANGQHSALYPLSVIYYLLPLPLAYGVFTVVQLGLAGIWMYLLARTLRAPRLGAFLSGIGFQFSGFLIVSVVHPMILAAASWLPLILLLVELTIRRDPFWRWGRSGIPWTLLGAVALGCQILAGHGENTYFVLLVTGAFAGWRLIHTALMTPRSNWRKLVITPALSLLLLVGLGAGLGAVQLLPLYDVIQTSFRQGSVSLSDVLGWAYPVRRLITFLIPNFFGNPAHHSVQDVFTGQLIQATVNSQGQPIQSFDWGIKNYVEGGAYLGLLPIFLAGLAVLRPLLFGEGNWRTRVRRWFEHPYIPFFSFLGLFSLGCIYGTPLYAIVYALPFLNQSHSPFRWVFPLTVSVMVLAALGVSEIRTLRATLEERWRGGVKSPRRPWWMRVLFLNTTPGLVSALAAFSFWGGVLLFAGLWISRLIYPTLEPGIERVFLSLAKAPEAFPDVRTFYSYEFPWILLASLLLMGTGVVLRVAHCPIYLPARLQRRPVWEAMAIVILLVDMWSFGVGFNPASDPAWLTTTPPVVDFLRKDATLWRFSAFDPHGAKTFNMNAGMYFGFQDIRGYDSLFSQQYVRYMQWIEPQGELLYNRIASFSQFSSLDSPLTDLLNVKYIFSEIEVPLPKYREVFRQGDLRVYENLSVMPRAYTLPLTATLVVSDVNAISATIQTHDPRFFAIVEAADVTRVAPGRGLCDTLPCHEPAQATAQPQVVVAYELNQVVVEAHPAEPAWLVLGDAYAAGWKAFVRPVGTAEDAEHEVQIARMVGNFRGVVLEPGDWTVRFKYSPDSVKVGAFTSFLAGMILVFIALIWGWRRGYQQDDESDSTVKRVARNSVAPIALNLFNRAIDFALAALMLRILGPANAGDYYYAIVIFGWFEIFTNFGLNAYLTREVSCCRDRASSYWFNTTALRFLLVLAALPVLGGVLWLRQALITPALNSQTLITIGLLYLALVPGSFSTGLTALFYAYEKAEYPAALTTLSTLLKATFGVIVLVLGWGIVGLAGSAVVISWVTMAILAVVAWRSFFTPRWELDRTLQRAMLVESWPLMINHLLATLFFKVDVVLLEAMRGSEVVGWYSTAYKFLDALNIIPSMFTMAVFPVVSQQAQEDREALTRFYRLGVKLLVLLALPGALVGTLLAEEMVLLLGSQAYLPHSMIALQLMIWSIPIGWINSLTNYVLIALNQQRYLTRAFVIGLVFNLAANLLLIPVYGYAASAVITIFSELALLIPFAIGLQRQLGDLHWLEMLSRPLGAGTAMGLAAWLLLPFGRGVALLGGIVLYGLILWRWGMLAPEERKILAPLFQRGQA